MPKIEIQPEEIVFLNCFVQTFNRPYAAYLAGYVPEIPRGKGIDELTQDEKTRLGRSANRLLNRRVIKERLNLMINDYFEKSKTFSLENIIQHLTNIIIKCQMNEYRNTNEVKNSIEASKILLLGFPSYGREGSSGEKINMFRNSEDVIKFEKLTKRSVKSLKSGDEK